MLKIDSHQHFWIYNPVRDSWIDDEMKTIRRDFLPDDLEPLLAENGIDGCVAVQASQTPEENRFLMTLAAKHAFIKGIVGWVDLQADNIAIQLAGYSRQPVMKGFRHVLQSEPERDLMLHPAFMRGIGLLKKYNFTFDILIFNDQLQYLPEFVAAFPDQPFVIDHLAKPDIKNQTLEPWRSEICKLAQFKNVSCKLSGMVTEAGWHIWKPGDFTPFLDAVFDAFGPERLMYGSDWPVCNLAGGYNKALQLVQKYVSNLGSTAQQLVFGGNAVRFYNLD